MVFNLFGGQETPWSNDMFSPSGLFPWQFQLILVPGIYLNTLTYVDMRLDLKILFCVDVGNLIDQFRTYIFAILKKRCKKDETGTDR